MTNEHRIQTVPLREVAVHLHAQDNVAIAKVDLRESTGLTVERDPGPPLQVVVHQSIPSGHKVALQQIAAGEPVRRYGQVIGHASQPILPGEHVHVHNLGVQDFERDHAFGVDARPVSFVPDTERRTFLGFERPDGQVGTRNYIAVISTRLLTLSRPSGWRPFPTWTA